MTDMPPPPDPSQPPPDPGQPGWGAPAPPPPPGYGAPPPGAPPGAPGYGSYGPPGWGPPGTPQAGTNQKAIWALVTGIVGLLCGPVGIVGIVLGNQARNEIRVSGQQGDGMALAGLITGIIGVAFWLLRLALWRSYFL